MDGFSIGIRAPVPPLSGVQSITYRMQPQDFVVVEIDTDGVAVGSSSEYKHPAEVAPKEQKETTAAEAAAAVFSSIAETKKKVTFSEAVGEDFVESLRQSLEQFVQRITTVTQPQKDDDVSGGGGEEEGATISSLKIAECQQLLTPDSSSLLPWVKHAVAREFPLLTPSFVSKNDQIQFQLCEGVRALLAVSSDPAAAIRCWKFLSKMNMKQQQQQQQLDFAMKAAATKDERRAVHEAVGRFCDGKKAPFRKVVRNTNLLSFQAVSRQPHQQQQKQQVNPVRRQRGDESIVMTQTGGDEGAVAAAASGGSFCYLVMDRRDVAAFNAKRIVAETLGCSVNAVQVSGTKDRRAVTTQRISVPLNDKVHQLFFSSSSSSSSCSPSPSPYSNFQVINHHNSSNNGSREIFRSAHGSGSLSLRCPVIRRSPISLGSAHIGNWFCVKIRVGLDSGSATPESTVQELKQRIAALQQSGGGRVRFPNFFGPQRFGVILEPSQQKHHHQQQAELIGLLIARGQYQRAAKAFFHGSQEEDDDPTATNNSSSSSSSSSSQLARVKDMLWPAAAEAGGANRDIAQDTVDTALKLLPSSATSIVELLKAVRFAAGAGGARVVTEDTWRQALESLNFDQKQIWCHAAQSFLFNIMLSSRLNNSSSSANDSFTDNSSSSSSSSSNVLPLLGRKTAVEFNERIDDALRAAGIDSREEFCSRMECLLGGSSGSFPGSTRPCFASAEKVSLELVPSPEQQQQQQQPSFCFVQLKCQLGTGSFVSVLVRQLFGVFALEPKNSK